MKLHGPSMVLVADGARARLFEERRRGGVLVEISEQLEDLTQVRPVESASAGAAHQRIGKASHRGDAETADDKREAAFLHRLADRAWAIARAAGCEDLVIFAPPKALGQLRRHMKGRVGPTESRDRLSESAEALRRHLFRIRAEG